MASRSRSSAAASSRRWRSRSAAADLTRRDASAFIVANALGSFGLGVAAFYLNFLYRALGFDEAAIGALAAALGIGGVIGAGPATLLARSLSRRGAVLVGGGITATGVIGLLSFETLVPLLLSAGLVGCGGIVVASSGSALIADATRGHDRAAMFGRQIAIATVAAFLASFIAGALAEPVGSWIGYGARDARTIRLLIAIGGSIAGVSAVPMFFIRAPRVVPGGHERPLRLRLLGRFIVVEALFGFGAGSFLPFMNLFFADRFALDLRSIGVALGFLAAAGSVGALLHARVLASRLGAVRAAVLAELSSLPFAVVAAFSGDATLAVAVLSARALLMFGASATMVSFEHSSFAPAERAGAHAVFELAWRGSAAVAAAVSGLVRAALGPSGYTANLLTLVVAYALAALATWALFREHEPSGDALAAPHSPV